MSKEKIGHEANLAMAFNELNKTAAGLPATQSDLGRLLLLVASILGTRIEMLEDAIKQATPTKSQDAGEMVAEEAHEKELHDLRVCFCKVGIQRHAQNPDDWSAEQMRADRERWPEAFEQAMAEKDGAEPDPNKCPGCGYVWTTKDAVHFKAHTRQDPPYVCADCREKGGARMIPIQEAIDRISTALERRSGRPWTVTTLEDVGLPEWLRVTTTDDRLVTDRLKNRGMADIDRRELALCFNLRRMVPFGGKLIPPNYRHVYANRAVHSPTDPPENTKCPDCGVILTAETQAYFEAKQSQDPLYKCHDCRRSLAPPTF